jgi:pyrroline-5-carboxylate reductase
MRITFLGGGNMAAALIGGLIRRGRAAGELRVVEISAQARARLEDEFGVRCGESMDAESLACELIVLAVKPQQMRAACAPLAGALSSQLVVSIAAGLRLADLARWLGGYRRIVRTMPNTPALIGAGITGLCAAPEVSAEERARAEEILAAVGEVLWIEDEAMMDAVTAVSGSGPAYVFYFIEALQAAAREVGFDVEQARKLACATVLGASRLAAQSAEDAATLRERVTSAGGTTEAALRALERDGFAPAIARAVRAADARGRELGALLGKD